MIGQRSSQSRCWRLFAAPGLGLDVKASCFQRFHLLSGRQLHKPKALVNSPMTASSTTTSSRKPSATVMPSEIRGRFAVVSAGEQPSVVGTQKITVWLSHDSSKPHRSALAHPDRGCGERKRPKRQWQKHFPLLERRSV